jgi:hypothetical protein
LTADYFFVIKTVVNFTHFTRRIEMMNKMAGVLATLVLALGMCSYVVADDQYDAGVAKTTAEILKGQAETAEADSAAEATAATEFKAGLPGIKSGWQQWQIDAYNGYIATGDSLVVDGVFNDVDAGTEYDSGLTWYNQAVSEYNFQLWAACKADANLASGYFVNNTNNAKSYWQAAKGNYTSAYMAYWYAWYFYSYN